MNITIPSLHVVEVSQAMKNLTCHCKGYQLHYIPSVGLGLEINSLPIMEKLCLWCTIHGARDFINFHTFLSRIGYVYRELAGEPRILPRIEVL